MGSDVENTTNDPLTLLRQVNGPCHSSRRIERQWMPALSKFHPHQVDEDTNLRAFEKLGSEIGSVATGINLTKSTESISEHFLNPQELDVDVLTSAQSHSLAE